MDSAVNTFRIQQAEQHKRHIVQRHQQIIDPHTDEDIRGLSLFQSQQLRQLLQSRMILSRIQMG